MVRRSAIRRLLWKQRPKLPGADRLKAELRTFLIC